MKRIIGAQLQIFEKALDVEQDIDTQAEHKAVDVTVASAKVWLNLIVPES